MASTETAAPIADAERTGWRRRRPSDLMVVGVVLALLGLSALAWWWRHPGMFGNQGNVVSIYSPVGTTAWLNLAQPLRKLEPDTVTIHSVEPQVVKGNATIEVVACKTSPGKPGVGAVRGALDEYCERHKEAEGSTLRVDDQLLLRVHSDEPDRGVKVLYSYGWQRGSQVTGQTVRVRFGTKTVQEHLTSR